jgi:hypothetical protein
MTSFHFLSLQIVTPFDQKKLADDLVQLSGSPTTFSIGGSIYILKQQVKNMYMDVRSSVD